MIQRGWLYRVDGSVEEITPKNKRQFTSREIQKMVGGSIEGVPYDDPAFCVFCNEEFDQELPDNENATEIFVRQNQLMCGWGPEYKLQGNIVKLDAVGGWATHSDAEKRTRNILESIERLL